MNDKDERPAYIDLWSGIKTDDDKKRAEEIFREGERFLQGYDIAAPFGTCECPPDAHVPGCPVAAAEQAYKEQLREVIDEAIAQSQAPSKAGVNREA